MSVGNKRMKALSGKVALVTGASRGLGRAIALELGRAGAAVAVTDILLEDETVSEDELKRIGGLGSHFVETEFVRTRASAKEIQEMGSQAIALKLDVASAQNAWKAVNEVRNTLGSVDILVNNAALMDNFAFLDQQDPERWEQDLRVNLTGAFHCAKAVWPEMVKEGWGRIINISSFVGLMGAFAQPSYGASKAGLIGLTRSLALEGAKFGITVNAVLPGFIETDALRFYDTTILERVKSRAAMKRLGKPEEVASLVVFLASGLASYITGAAIPVTGGADLFTF
jgi:3-oxoacyl-[acyl-carrier protein] reductase